MKNIKSHFKFNKQERSGIFFLLLIIVLLQCAYFFFKTRHDGSLEKSLSVDTELQAEIDVLKKHQVEKDSFKMYPFNPNFITDYKGYTLGMSVIEIDRLHAFRAMDKFANSAKEFQEVTQVSDSLLNSISPYFKFPEWTQKKRKQSVVFSDSKNNNIKLAKNSGRSQWETENQVKTDLNAATVDELKQISGIGEKLSTRIIKFRNRLGGFLVNEQLYDVYGLEPIVVERTLERFQVMNPPEIKKININTASASEISQLVYIQYSVAQRIVDYRKNKGNINSFDELKDIDGFPLDKIGRIQLYLSLH